MRDLFIYVLLLATTTVEAQELVGLSTKWDDSFSEWIMVTEDETEIGEIVMRWPLKDDWTEWDYRLGESSGAIKVKWRGDANLWEVRGENEIVTIKTIWPNDWRQWEVKSGDKRIDVKSTWANILEEWSASDDDLGELYMYTAWEGDLRDWVIEDNLSDQVSLPFKVALIFIPVFYATPKF